MCRSGIPCLCLTPPLDERCQMERQRGQCARRVPETARFSHSAERHLGVHSGYHQPVLVAFLASHRQWHFDRLGVLAARLDSIVMDCNKAAKFQHTSYMQTSNMRACLVCLEAMP